MPSNVSELLTRAQLDNARDVYRLIESRSELNPYQERELAAKIINKLVDYHSTTIEKRIEENKAESIAGWAIDFSGCDQLQSFSKESIFLTTDP